MTYCEYYYFTGEHDKAVDLAELYLSHPDPVLRLSACLIYTFANLSLNRINSATGGLKSLKENLDQILKKEDNRKTTAFAILQPLPHKRSFIFQSEMFLLCQTISELPVGMRLWGGYILAHNSYLSQEYEKSLGIVHACLMLSTDVYPIAMIYLNLMGAMDAMNLRKQELTDNIL